MSENIVNRAFIGVLLGISSFGVKFLGNLSTSVNLLNERIAVIVERVNTHESKFQSLNALPIDISAMAQTLNGIDKRLTQIESRQWPLRKIQN